jgi:hypothetical protein
VPTLFCAILGYNERINFIQKQIWATKQYGKMELQLVIRVTNEACDALTKDELSVSTKKEKKERRITKSHDST